MANKTEAVDRAKELGSRALRVTVTGFHRIENGLRIIGGGGVEPSKAATESTETRRNQATAPKELSEGTVALLTAGILLGPPLLSIAAGMAVRQECLGWGGALFYETFLWLWITEHARRKERLAVTETPEKTEVGSPN